MPCHMSCHWTLLVCRLKKHYWEFYDSLRSSCHRATLQNLVHSHNRMKAKVSFFLRIYLSCRLGVYMRMLVMLCKKL
ncbi:hypothetical protein KSP40_PGU011316 [Platanthera guangdongensis]|uniref:Ubiquitin-like protease family profile domain-containing protein n=1 Tax=Platanthera guangdongensis TaxID=2320717 RepID=A0ABR2MI21_9ASPA